MGLIGLSAYAAERRTREIGIRRVLGSTARGIVALLSREFLLLVLVSNAIAIPFMVWAVHRWLRTFAYQAEIGWSLFGAAGLAVLLMALLAVSYQAIRAATANPVDSLRHE
jgi:putative ABC transport system permease protein